MKGIQEDGAGVDEQAVEALSRLLAPKLLFTLSSSNSSSLEKLDYEGDQDQAVAQIVSALMCKDFSACHRLLDMKDCKSTTNRIPIAAKDNLNTEPARIYVGGAG